MWQPKTVGEVIAERTCELRRGHRRLGQVSVCFGRPVQGPRPEAGDPWWCPIRIKGPGLDAVRVIAGHDSLQALILALEYTTQTLPHAAKRMGGEITWLGDQERVIFARQTLSHAGAEALMVLLGRLKGAAEILDSQEGASRGTATRSMRALAALGASVGFPTPSKTRRNTRKK